MSPLVLNVVRVGGAFGRVSVSWEVMGDHENGEVTPTQGQVRILYNRHVDCIEYCFYTFPVGNIP